MYLWKECTHFEKSWLVFCMISFLALFALKQIDDLSLVTAYAGSLCIFFAAKAKIATFYFGIVYNLLYALHCYLVNDDLVMYLHLFFHLPLQIFGMCLWQKNSIGHPTLQENILLRRLFPNAWIAIVLSLILIVAFTAQVIYSLGNGIPNLVIVAVIFSIIANVLMLARFVECWVAWISVNVFNMGYWIYASMLNPPIYISGFMMTVFLINCLYGCYRWNQISKLQNEMFVGPYCSLRLASDIKKQIPQVGKTAT